MSDRAITLRLPQAYLDALDSVVASYLQVPEREREISPVSRSALIKIALGEFFRSRGVQVPAESSDETGDV